jgi:hypothetical protein
MASSNMGIAIGVNGLMFKTTNGGTTWTALNSNTSNIIYNIQMINSDVGFIVTHGGGILKTVSGGAVGITKIAETIPEHFSLSQNYPNPFNPSTKIRFQVSPFEGGKGDVKLIIYDALGKQIATLVNQQLVPGTYEVEWNASNYSSGVYFYTLQAGDYRATQKMVLIK